MNEDENSEIGWRKELLEKEPKKLKEGSCSKSGHYRKLSSTTDSTKSSSSDSSSGSENSSDCHLKDASSEKTKEEKKLLKKKMHKEEKHLKREKKKLEKIQRREMKKAKKEKRREERKLKKLAKKAKHNETETVDCSIPIDLMYPKAKAPETKEEYEARQSRIRRELDPVTGRSRLIKGDGEVLEEIVSRDKHKEINKQATEEDGNFFQTKTVGWNVP